MPAVTDRTAVTLTGHDQYLFREGTHSRLYEKMGAHFMEDATHFAVWAPNAVSVAVVGDFNGWDPRKHPMQAEGESGSCA
jgi:1,4-alpha-glucan branching enzyme